MSQTEATPTDASGSVRCTPPPAWVEHEPYALPPAVGADQFIDNGVCRLLYDSQVDLCEARHAWHHHTARRVLTRAGAEQVSHFAVEFDPSYESVEVHFVRVIRDSEIFDHAREGAFQIFRRETNLERLTLNGRLTASLLIPDIRAGDIIEAALTIHGSNPALAGKYVGWLGFDDLNPWFDYRQRLRRPQARQIFVKPFNDPPAATAKVMEGVEDTRWSSHAQARREVEELTPPWVIQTPTVQFSEFEDWAEVARLFAPYYETAEMPEVLTAEIDRLRDASPAPADRAVELLRFVQRELRYFALSLGEGGFVPRGLAAIWASRFGDCKDAAQLYVAGARRMGLDACAALTSTTHGQVLADFLPSSGLFNHCIVRLRLEGRSYWLDPTMPLQSGRLSAVYQPHSGWALSLSGDGDTLERLGDDRPIHHLNVHDEVEFKLKTVQPARLTRQYEFYSWAADSVRNRFANEGSGGFAKEVLEGLQQVWAKVVAVGAVTVNDDPTENCLTVILCYDIPECWTSAGDRRLGFTCVDVTVAFELAALKAIQRRTELYLGRPRKVSHRVVMRMPRKWSGNGWSQGEEAAGLNYANRLTIEGHTIVNDRTLTVDAWSMPAAAATDYGRVTASVRENMLKIWAWQRFGSIRSVAFSSFGFNWETLWLGVVALMFMGWIFRVVETLRRGAGQP